ncbi:MAG: Jag N-terminal domain-containing protein [Clostridia bacterium]|nr:Jag N-terminal domain-containing protein [Clostridia bacterium]
MIIKEAIGKGATVEAAREDALEKLGAKYDEDVQFEVVAFPKKKVLGLFGGCEAEVRVFVEGPDAAPKKEKNNRNDNRKKNNEPKAPKLNKEPKQKPQKAEVEKVEKTETAKTEAAEEFKGVPASEVDPNSQAGRAYKYLSEILNKLGCEDFTAVIGDIEGGSKIVLEGSEKLGVVIGRRGETLDALQYLASLVANENVGGYYRVVIDIGNYREKRESTLEALAKRTAGQVLRTGRSRSLEPMNPYERRIIHTAVQAIEGVYSASVGDGSNRRVVIAPEGKQVRPSDDRRGGRGSRDRRGSNRQGRSARPQSSETPAVQKPKETDGTKLYGKLK